MSSTPDTVERGAAALERMQKLSDEAWNDLQEGRYDAALSKARVLRAAGFSTCDEIEGRSLLAKGSPQAALRVLQSAPQDLFDNGLWLGRTLQQLGRSDEALAAYKVAARCSDAREDEVRSAQVQCLRSAGRRQEALEACEVPASGDFRCELGVQRAELLLESERTDEAAVLARLLLPSAGRWKPWVLQVLAVSDLQAGRRDPALRHAVEALRGSHLLPGAARVVNQLETGDGKRFWLTVQGRWHLPAAKGEKPVHFLRLFHVAARDLNGALALAREQEPADVQLSVRVDQVKTLGAFPSKYGILSKLGHIFY